MKDGALERHSLRVFLIMQRLAADAAVELDDEVALCAALLHDIGLYEPAARPRLYLAHGREVARRIVGSFGWTAERERVCLDAIELHHRLRPQWHLGAEVELLRIADLVDTSKGVAGFGVDRGWLVDLFRSIRREGLYRELLRHSVRDAPCMSRSLAAILSYPVQAKRWDVARS